MRPDVSEFYIEKPQMPVTLTLAGGEQLSGSVFAEASARGSSLEDASEFLNGPETFFPVRLGDGAVRLLAKNHVLAMHAVGDFGSEQAWQYGEPVAVAIVMSGGMRKTGKLMIEHFAAHTRVLDYLNRVSDAFVVLRRADGILLLNREHIAYVEQLDDAAA
jgi:hypothetical protein